MSLQDTIKQLKSTREKVNTKKTLQEAMAVASNSVDRRIDVSQNSSNANAVWVDQSSLYSNLHGTSIDHSWQQQLGIQPGFPQIPPSPIPANPIPTVPTTPEPHKLNVANLNVKAGTNGLLSVMLLDNSGSMKKIKTATLTGVNEFKQKQIDDNTDQLKFNIITFSGENINVIYNDVDNFQMTEADYTTEGSTNLLDAIGFCVEGIAEKLKVLPEADRPSVVFTIITDGEENSSAHYTQEMIKKMLSATEENGWAYMFLGANIDAFSVGSKMGFTASNTMQYSVNNIGSALSSAASATTRMYSSRTKGVVGDAMYESAAFTTDERKKAV